MVKILFAIIGRGGLIPWIENTSEPLDKNLNPCAFSRKHCNGMKGDYHAFKWLGITAGFSTNIRELDLNDTIGHTVSLPCPNCNALLLVSLAGEKWCDDCDYHGNLFKDI